MTKPHSLAAILEEEFPERATVAGVGKPEPQDRPRDEERFRRNLDAIATRLRLRTHIVMGGVGLWFLVVLVIVLAANDHVKAAIALASSGIGVPWCIAVVARMSQRLMLIEVLLEAAKDGKASLAKLVEIARDDSKEKKASGNGRRNRRNGKRAGQDKPEEPMSKAA